MNSSIIEEPNEKKFLVVDDCPINRLMVGRTLEMMDFNIDRILNADNGQRAIDLLSQHKVDLIVLDMFMPGLNGYEVLSALEERDDWRNIPVLVVTAESHEECIEKLGEVAAGFVHKPFTAEELREEVMRIVTKNTKLIQT